MVLIGLFGCPLGVEDTAAADPCDESAAGNICTYAGGDQAGYNGEGLDRRESWLYWPIDIEFSPYGLPLVHDWNNHRLRVVGSDDTVTTVMGTDFVGDGPPDLSDRQPPGAPGTTVNLNHPTDGVYLPDGTFIDASWHTHKLRAWNPATGLAYVHCGDGVGYAGDDEPTAADALFNQPKSVVYDESDGTLYILDMRNERVRALDADFAIRTVGGNGVKGAGGDGGLATEASFGFPNDTNPRPGGALALDGRLLYVADPENHRVRAIDLDTGIITTVAGTGVAGFSGDGGSAATAQLNYPMDIEVEDGFLWIADTDNGRVRAVDLATLEIDTVAGDGEVGSDGDGGPATGAQLYSPMGVELDLDGNLYIADSGNHRIRRVAR
ncbi:MAG: PQQ-binding-like beta-propeller repeat protein [Deltaproteobacteria bacterium]|nr:PQQ-binding-like beta-propeller repeat protein [Deltaproteobacteria bacterium]